MKTVKIVAIGAMASATLVASMSANAIGSESVFNVRDYGATGDGITDDSASIRLAIEAAKSTGGRIYFPMGTYRVTTLTWAGSVGVENNMACFVTTNNDLTFEGDTSGTSVIKKDHNISTGNGHVFWCQSGKNLAFRNLTIDGNTFAGDAWWTAVGTLIDLNFVKDVLVDNCILINAQEHALDFEEHASTVWINNCIITNSGRAAIHGDFGDGKSRISGCYIAYAPDKTVFATSLANFNSGTAGAIEAAIDQLQFDGYLNISDTTFEHCPLAVSAIGAFISNCKFFGGTDQTNIIFDGAIISGSRITGCELLDTGNAGFPIQFLPNKFNGRINRQVSIDNCVVGNNILMTMADSIQIRNNRFLRGIFMTGRVVNCDISGNLVDNINFGVSAFVRMDDSASFVQTNLISDNLIVQNGSYSYGFYIGTSASARNIIRGNVVQTSFAGLNAVDFANNQEWIGNWFSDGLQVNGRALLGSRVENNKFTTFTVNGSAGANMVVRFNTIGTFGGTATDMASWTSEGNTGGGFDMYNVRGVQQGITNLATVAVDFKGPFYSLLPITGDTAFTAPVNVDVTGKSWQHVITLVTNSAAGPSTLTFPPGVVAVGSPLVTGRSQVDWWQYANQQTNAIIQSIN